PQRAAGLGRQRPDRVKPPRPRHIPRQRLPRAGFIKPKVTLLRFLRLLSLWLFWPGVALIVWGELTPAPPHLEGLFGWDKLDHFIAYFGLAAMATMIVGIRPRLVAILAAIAAFSGLLELIQFAAGRDA